MRTMYAEFYARTDDELKTLWKGGLVSLDANVLLGLYAYPQKALDDFFLVLEKLGDRLWLPYQVGLEYHRNRGRALPMPRQVIDRIGKSLKEIHEKIEGLGFPEFHPTLELKTAEGRRSDLLKVLDALESYIGESLNALPTADQPVHGPDALRNRLEKVFDKRIGAQPTADILNQWRKDAEQRFAKKVPPGFNDSAKDSDAKYGDVFIWRSLIAELEQRKKASGIIFVTNDRKDDWWLRRDKERELYGPRPELIRECLDVTKRLVHFYTPSEFLEDARTVLALKVAPESVAAAESVSQQSPVRSMLRDQRMEVPDVTLRIEVLRALFTAIQAGKVRTAGDINEAIRQSFRDGAANYIINPLFYSLINETYGPIRLTGDLQTRLRDRNVALKEEASTPTGFMHIAHVAWLAQALYRIRRGGFEPPELTQAFFGDLHSPAAPLLIEEAWRAMEQDAVLRAAMH